MKTTLELPDDLMREIKVKAAREDRKLKDLVADLLRRGLEREDEPDSPGEPIKFPVIPGLRRPKPGEEPTPERIAQILNDEEASWYSAE